MQYTYLLVDFFTILIPFLFSFHPKLKFYKTWYAFFPAVIISGFIFVIWDMYFTGLGVWGFNERYLTGIEIGNLPLEEVLFFFCIPYACIFTFHCLDLFLKGLKNAIFETSFTVILALLLFASGAYFFGRAYTASTFFSFGILLLLTRFVFKVNWLNRFFFIYGILLLPFFIVNGILTGTGIEEQVVWYNPSEFMGFRILTVPVEDIFYGAGLILLNLLIYKYILARKAHFSSLPKNNKLKKSRML
ncbi:MAG: lycopene cyclase domain-containing protein [Salinimicrobium sp.]